LVHPDSWVLVVNLIAYFWTRQIATVLLCAQSDFAVLTLIVQWSRRVGVLAKGVAFLGYDMSWVEVHKVDLTILIGVGNQSPRIGSSVQRLRIDFVRRSDSDQVMRR
jgi:hypothetical protein